MSIPGEKNNAGPPPLGGTARDTGVALIKGAVGTIPVAGSILAEIAGKIIPEQRIGRLEVYVRYLNERLGEINERETRERMLSPESIHLFEEGAIQSARALSDERKVYIARLVAKGMTGEEKEKIEAKRLMNLLGQLDDDQIIILLNHLETNRRDQTFRKQACRLAQYSAATREFV